MLVDAREKLHIPWGDQANQQHGDSLMAFDTRSTKMASGQLEASVFLPYLPAIKALWADVGIQNAYDRRREFQLVGGRWRRRSTQTHSTGRRSRAQIFEFGEFLPFQWCQEQKVKLNCFVFPLSFHLSFCVC